MAAGILAKCKSVWKEMLLQTDVNLLGYLSLWADIKQLCRRSALDPFIVVRWAQNEKFSTFYKRTERVEVQTGHC